MVDAQVTLAIVTGLLPAAWLFWQSTALPASSWHLLHCLPLLAIYYIACLFLYSCTPPGFSWKLLRYLALGICYTAHLYFGIYCAVCLSFGIYYAACLFLGIIYAACLVFGIYYAAYLFLESTISPASAWKLLHCLQLLWNIP